MANLYIDPEFLYWYCDQESGVGFDADYRFRSHEIWRHARDKVHGVHSDLDKIDCLSSLKRSVNHRIKAIYKGHSIDGLPSQHGRKKSLEKLQEYGIVRPAILKDMFTIRNEIEHEDIAPPDADTCRRYVDIVWYFLKSTDELVNMSNTDIVFTHPDDEFIAARSVTIDTSEKWDVFKITANISKDLVRVRKPAGEWLKISKSEKKIKKNKLLFITGELTLTSGYLKSFAHEYFSTYGYFIDDE